MEIVIGSDQERENRFAEIRRDGQPSAEVILNGDSKRFELTVFTASDETLVVELTEFHEALEQARQALTARGYSGG